jgi:tetratricopeptide (TPR) repeat protein
MKPVNQPILEMRCIVRKFLLVPCLLLLFVRMLPAQSDDFSRGEDLFMQNKPREAQALVERTTLRESSKGRAFLYLGIVYQQLDMTDEAIATYRKILPRAGTETARIAYNLGNAYYTKGSAVFAEQYYTQAIEADPSYASAYLNRGNTRIKTGALNTAIPDYELFLTLEPRSPKRPQIEQLMAVIRQEAAAEEQRKVQAAELAERQRRQAEQAAREEAERRQRMMDELSASLQSAAENTKGLSAGSEDVLGYDGEFELE